LRPHFPSLARLTLKARSSRGRPRKPQRLSSRGRLRKPQRPFRGGRRVRQQHHLRKAARRPGRLAQVAASMSQSLTQNDAQASRGRLSWRPPSFRVWTCCGAVQDIRPERPSGPLGDALTTIIVKSHGALIFIKVAQLRWP